MISAKQVFEELRAHNCIIYGDAGTTEVIIRLKEEAGYKSQPPTKRQLDTHEFIQNSIVMASGITDILQHYKESIPNIIGVGGDITYELRVKKQDCHGGPLTNDSKAKRTGGANSTAKRRANNPKTTG